MDTTSKATEIGYINACIAGDHRYSTRLSVQLDGDKCHIIVSENGAVGGMDGPGGAYGFHETKRVTVDTNPSNIVKAIKQVINAEQPSIIKTYGKPTKNFRWVGVQEKGLAARLVIQAKSFLDE